MSLHLRDEIATARLDLIAIDAAMLQAEQAGATQLGPLLDCVIPANWPPVDWEPHVWATLLEHYERHPGMQAWNRYVVLRRPGEQRLLIGCAGAFWSESKGAEGEIGYSILPPHEGRGYATETAIALIHILRSDGRLSSVVAHTFPHLLGSIRVMEKCGLRFDGVGEEEGTVRYRLHL